MFKFFSYITFYDKLLLVIGTLSAILAGAILPSISLIMGNVADAFTSGGGSSGTDIISNMTFIASYVVLIATTLFTFSYMFFAFW
jgi:ATP-binding cassette subfamily B (MDR/TAP) protein 1